MLDNQDLYNEDAEKNILGIMMIDNSKALSISSLVDYEDFFLASHRQIYQAIVSLLKANKVADIVSVSEKLKFENRLEDCGGREYISLLALGVTTLANFKQYCKIIVKYSKKRKILYVADETVKMFEAGQDVDEVAEYLRRSAEQALLSKSSTNLSSLFSGLDDVMEEITTVLQSDTKTFGISTGFPSLDKSLSGLCKSKLYVLGARPSVGKSALAQQIAENVSKDHVVLFQSLEMKKEQYTKRSIFRKTGLNNDLLASGVLKVDDALDRVAQASGELAECQLEIDDTSNCTLSIIEKNILHLKETKGRCDLVVVDYLQLMVSDDKRLKDKYEIVSRNSRGLKLLANKYDIPIILLCQLSRALESRDDKRPKLSDLRDSGDIEQDADVVMFLFREEMHCSDPVARARLKGKAECIIAKNREGSLRVVPLVFNGAKTEFSEVIKND